MVAEYGSDLPRKVAAVASTWCRTSVYIAEANIPAHGASLSQLPTASTSFGHQVSVSVPNSLLGKPYWYQEHLQAAQPRLHQQLPHCHQDCKPMKQAKAQQQAKAKHPAVFQSASPKASSTTPAGRAFLLRPLDAIADLGL